MDAATEGYVRLEDAPALPPPSNTVGFRGWLLKNLFSSVWDSLLTLVFGLFILWALLNMVNWAVINATWTGENRDACIWEGAGACWPFVVAKFPQWIYGFYPGDQRWRISVCLIVGAIALAAMLVPAVPFKKWNAIFLLFFYPQLTIVLLSGGNFSFDATTYAAIIFLIIVSIAARQLSDHVAIPISCGWGIVFAAMLVVMLTLDFDFGLAPVETRQWGGLTLTLVISVSGIVASLPLGILLALGRQSNMPVVRHISVIFIEFWRGVPLITVLFMSSVMLPLFLPEDVSFDKLLRAMIGTIIVSSAYMAEVVRGGLQAIPKGQFEAARALGLSYWQMVGKIILPQALRISTPNIVSIFIGLFKDTTLVSIIGLFDLLGIVEAGFADPEWASPNSSSTGYFSAAVIFWIVCIAMSRYSIYIERRLATGYKR
ncbi:amino acid ABC transporter permease [Aminobacter sp. AP02]|uniref:amino acid ABC transporter permease n=1 Tax=Aminobacter sp. AP02 TaxID=2135737 RepID=UPI001FE0F343|nr:amino acid ABC transporter permease [Aminobacter sp. AP02]